MTERLNLAGIYTSDGDYHQFELPALELQQLAAHLRSSSSQTNGSLTVIIGEGRLTFAPNNAGLYRASLAEDGTIDISGSSDDLMRLADRFLTMAQDNDPDHVGLVHTHLDLYLTQLNPGIADIVFERLDEEN
jgi:hypothetical protein